jgi:hypothetical protein
MRRKDNHSVNRGLLEEERMPQQTRAVNATYLPEVECKVRTGDADWERIAAVKDEKGREQYLTVSKGLLSTSGGKTYLSVGIVQVDHGGRRVLIELPVEADSGVRRLWVSFGSFRRGDQP